jgi:hypothetical protein
MLLIRPFYHYIDGFGQPEGGICATAEGDFSQQQSFSCLEEGERENDESLSLDHILENITILSLNHKLAGAFGFVLEENVLGGHILLIIFQQLLEDDLPYLFSSHISVHFFLPFVLRLLIPKKNADRIQLRLEPGFSITGLSLFQPLNHCHQQLVTGWGRTGQQLLRSIEQLRETSSSVFKEVGVVSLIGED